MDYESLKAPLKVKLGDGYEVDAIGSGSVVLKCPLPSGIVRNASCIKFCMCSDCHTIYSECQWLQNMEKP